ncbi:MAG: hypothetical protein H7A45_02540 [Verrucomicrobiales bacterium]|nr:hypothetical protein [Verrucomicrobiales bacterium]MCP5526457.1 hypothetical protein [Verrucomicrobiales bacterium]
MAQGWRTQLAALNPLGGRRLVVIDPGTRLLKLLVVRRRFLRVRVEQRHSVDLEGEGVLELEETRQHLESLFPELHGWDRAVLLPQDRTICQTVDVPIGGAAETRDHLLREARKLSGLDPANLSYAYTPLRPFGRFENPAWLTLCKREEVDRATTRFLVGDEIGGELEDGGLCEIATSAQGLFAASRMLRPRPENAVLVEFRTRLTVVAMLVDGQGSFATSLPLGFAQLAEAAAADGNVEVAEALTALREGPGFEAPGAHLQRALGEWHAAVQTAVREWLEDNPELNLSLTRLPAFVCGSGAQGQGVLRATQAMGPLKLRAWNGRMPGARGDADSYWVAYGLALQALRRGPHRLSLLPRELRRSARRRSMWRTWQRANAVILLLLALTLAWVTGSKRALVERKEGMIQRAQEVLQATREMVRLHARLNRDYAALHPVLQREQRTLDALQALGAMRGRETNRVYWYVLFSDADSYAAGTTLPESLQTTNRPRYGPDPAAGRREFIAEVVVPLEGNQLRTTLSRIVNDLRAEGIFRRVDALPPQRARDLVDPGVMVTNRLFRLSLELAGEAPQSPHTLNVPITLPPAKEAEKADGRTMPNPIRIISSPRSAGVTN